MRDLNRSESATDVGLGKDAQLTVMSVVHVPTLASTTGDALTV